MTRLQATLTAILACGLAIPASAQNPEKGFTFAPGVQTPFVFQAEPDAECDLHAAGVNDPAHTLRVYADANGFVRVQVNPQQAEDAHVQLDCTAAGKLTAYPFHLHAGSSPTQDMPAPQTSVPAASGAQVLPALTDQEARLLSDQYLGSLGYPARPDAAASPASYDKWLDLVSRPLTLLPAHSVNRSGRSHGLRRDQLSTAAGTEAGTKGSANWSGLEKRGKSGSFVGVNGEWNVPTAGVGAPDGNPTYSAFWIGLDGDGTKDLVQAGTEQDTIQIFGYTFTSYYAWSELLPNQPTEQTLGISVNPGDDVSVGVWVGDSNTISDKNGHYGWFYFQNKTQHQAVRISTPLSGTSFGGTEAEWIMERPQLGSAYASDLSAYVIAIMTNAWAYSTVGPTIPSGASDLQITMYNSDYNFPDNNVLSSALGATPEIISFFWFNFH